MATGDLDTQEFSQLIVCPMNKQRILVMDLITYRCILYEPEIMEVGLTGFSFLLQIVQPEIHLDSRWGQGRAEPTRMEVECTHAEGGL